jgi:hypothetical protein
MRLSAAEGNAGEFATEFVLKLLKKRLMSSPAAFRRTIAQHRATLKRNAQENRTKLAPALPLLRQRALEIDRGFETDEEFEEVEASAHSAAATALGILSPEEEALLDRLEAWAERASDQPDAKTERLLGLVRETCFPDGRWNEERLIIFTEYRDTQNALLDALVVDGLAEDERVQLLYGGMNTEERTRIKAAFQADPGDSPVRVLLATDAASEGINLQRHCYRMVHYEIPWNPNRLEQRNGRIDRHGQGAPKVLIYHFAPRGYERARTNAARVGELEGDLEFLCRAVEKVQAIREMLGKVQPVIAAQVEEAMLGRRSSIDTRRVEQEARALTRQLAFERKLREELEELQATYDQTRGELRLVPDHIEATVRVALELAGQPPLRSSGPGLWRLSALSGAWARCAEGLAHPYTLEPRPITFDPLILAERGDDVVLAHLGHRLVQMSLRLLRAEVWEADQTRRLQRVTARRVTDPRVRNPLAVVYARIVVTGASGHRLHEEIIQAGGYVREGKLERVGVNALTEALELPVDGTVSAQMSERLLAVHTTICNPLLSALEARARERVEGISKLVTRRRDDEVEKVTAVLTELRERILQELEQQPPVQLSLLDDDERDQLERDREWLRLRVQQIPDEIERETDALQRRFRDPEPRLFPVAVEYRVPAKLEIA